MATSELRPMSFTELLDRAFTMYRRNFLLFVTIMAGPYLLLLMVSLLPAALALAPGANVNPTTAVAVAVLSMVVLVFAYFAAMALGQAASMFAVSEISLGRTTTVGAAYARVRGKLWRMLLVMISVGLLVGLGFILLIIPGIILFLRYSVAIPVAVLEDRKVGDALGRSTSLTEGRRRDAFLIYFVTWVLTWIAMLLFMFPLGFYAGLTGNANSLVINVLGEIVQALAGVLVAPIGAITVALFYLDCRVRKEAFDLQVMLAALDGGPAAKPAEALVQS